jgi:hypothetical protein
MARRSTDKSNRPTDSVVRPDSPRVKTFLTNRFYHFRPSLRGCRPSLRLVRATGLILLGPVQRRRSPAPWRAPQQRDHSGPRFLLSKRGRGAASGPPFRRRAKSKSERGREELVSRIHRNYGPNAYGQTDRPIHEPERLVV